jgi:hypothetical protein
MDLQTVTAQQEATYKRKKKKNHFKQKQKINKMKQGISMELKLTRISLVE